MPLRPWVPSITEIQTQLTPLRRKGKMRFDPLILLIQMPRLSIKETNRMTTTTMIMVIGHDDNINNDDDDGKDLVVDSEHHDTKNSSSCGQDHHSGIVHA